MHISKLEIENIKSHVSSIFHFQRGATAITGENGAGKTTIIECIAWVLFDLLDYKKENFVRRGAKKGSVRVTIESGLDEREYIVFRDTGSAYHVTDPRLQTRIADKREEVFRFLWQHLGLEPGTDLRSLFRQAIGVPQGTFTAIFLEGATERKTAFDRLLKVEEYRQAAEKLRDTSRFIDQQVATVREGIARAEGELSRAEAVEQEIAIHREQAKQLADELVVVGNSLAAKQKEVQALEAQKEKVAELQLKADKLTGAKDRAELVFAQRQQAVTASIEARKKIEEAKPRADLHLKVLATLKELERERNERDRLRAEAAKIENAIAQVKSDQKRINAELDAAVKAKRDIELLRPKVEHQVSLEKEITGLRDKAAQARAALSQVTAIDERLVQLRQSYRANAEQLKAAEEKAALAAELAVLESRSGELMKGLATLQASLERDEAFQREIKNGLCPILSQKCLNLAPGETLEGFVSNQFVDLRSQIGTLETEQQAVSSRLVMAREGAASAAALKTYQDREKELAAEGKRLAEEKASLEKQAADLAALEEKLAAAESSLAILEDPRGRIHLLEQAAASEVLHRETLSEAEANLERLDRELKTLTEELEKYKDLDDNWSRMTSERDATLDAYRVFLANETEAANVEQRQQQLNDAKTELEQAEREAADAIKLLTEASASYNRDEHLASSAELLEMEKRHAEMKARLDASKQREQQLAVELERFASIRRSMQGELEEKERIEKVGEATAFIRDTLKEAAPRVARNYVYHVSLEANQMFREITGNAERTLKWTEDYSIVLEEDGYERPFPSLSGGEQMAAALSVRLTLLKQLSDVRIAFFDEPTTNLDIERRENLAAQISRITHFDQLFVISHDDTFDNYVDHVIALGN